MVGMKPILTGEEWDLMFLLPPIAFKLWLFHYRCEADSRESFAGEDVICAMCGIKRKALYKHRKWLVEHGWLIATSRAYPGHNPTFRVERGWIPAVGCQRHEEPVAGCLVCQENSRKRTEKGDTVTSIEKGDTVTSIEKGDTVTSIEKGDAFNAYPKKGTQKGDAYVSGSASGSSSLTLTLSASCTRSDGLRGQEEKIKPSSPSGEGKPENLKTVEPTPTSSAALISKPRRKPKCAPDGTPFPPEFDSWDNLRRCEWRDQHLRLADPPAPQERTRASSAEEVDLSDACPECLGSPCSCKDEAPAPKSALKDATAKQAAPLEAELVGLPGICEQHGDFLPCSACQKARTVKTHTYTCLLCQETYPGVCQCPVPLVDGGMASDQRLWNPKTRQVVMMSREYIRSLIPDIKFRKEEGHAPAYTIDWDAEGEDDEIEDECEDDEPEF